MKLLVHDLEQAIDWQSVATGLNIGRIWIQNAIDLALERDGRATQRNHKEEDSREQAEIQMDLKVSLESASFDSVCHGPGILESHGPDLEGEAVEKIVAVFGGRHPQPGDEEYEQARKLGQLIAKANFAVMNGGYGGVMEAVSMGAMEGGGHTIGVTMDIFEDLPANAYLREEIRTRHFFERLEVLISRSSAFIALRGGMGTLTEVSLVWNMLQTKAMVEKPVILVGSFWKPLFEGITQHLVVSRSDLDLLRIVETVDEAVEALPKR